MATYDPNERGEYPLGPGRAPNMGPSGRRPVDRPRIRTSLTGYDLPERGKTIPYFRRPVTHEPEPAISLTKQFTLGSLSPFASILIIWVLNSAMHSIGVPDEIIGFTIWVAFIALVLFLFYVSMNFNAFMAGLLTVILAIPVLLFCLCGIAIVGGAFMAVFK